MPVSVSQNNVPQTIRPVIDGVKRVMAGLVPAIHVFELFYV